MVPRTYLMDERVLAEIAQGELLALAVGELSFLEAVRPSKRMDGRPRLAPAAQSVRPSVRVTGLGRLHSVAEHRPSTVPKLSFGPDDLKVTAA